MSARHDRTPLHRLTKRHTLYSTHSCSCSMLLAHMLACQNRCIAY